MSDQLSLRNPALYVRGQWNLDLNLKTFAMWILNAFAHALIVFFLPTSLRDEVRSGDGGCCWCLLLCSCVRAVAAL